MIRSICIRYGLPMRDDRENVTTDLLLRLTKIIDVNEHIDLCCLSACIIAFLSCLRCGEFTVNQPEDRFLKKSDWKQDSERGQIYMKYSKTDIFGRGHFIKYRKLRSDIQ